MAEEAENAEGRSKQHSKQARELASEEGDQEYRKHKQHNHREKRDEQQEAEEVEDGHGAVSGDGKDKWDSRIKRWVSLEADKSREQHNDNPGNLCKQQGNDEGDGEKPPEQDETPRRRNPWNEFQAKHGKKGFTQEEIKNMYWKSKIEVPESNHAQDGSSDENRIKSLQGKHFGVRSAKLEAKKSNGKAAPPK